MAAVSRSGSGGGVGPLGAWVLAGLAVLAGVAAAVARGPLDPTDFGTGAALAAAGAGWMVGCTAARGRPGEPPRRGGPVLWLVVAVAVALRAVVLLAPPPQTSDDVNRYVWEGELVRGGRSPYARAPADPELADVRARLPGVHAGTNHPDVSAAYPPVAQAAFAGVVAAAARVADGPRGTAFERAALGGMRLLFAACDLLVLIPLVALLRRAGRPDAAVVAWAWCPLVALEFAGSAHFDSLGILLWTAGLALAAGAATRARRLAGLVLEVAAVLVKLLPVCGLPFVHRGRGAWRDALVAAGLAAAAFAPLLVLEGGAGGLGRGLSEYALRWESTSLLYRFVEPALAGVEAVDPRGLGRAAIAVVWLALAAWLWARRVEPVRACGVLVGAFLALSPTLHPWYLTWIVPFVALRPSAAWTWLLAAAPWLYAPLVRWRTEGAWAEPAWLWPAVAGPFLALLLVDGARALWSRGTAA